MEDNPLQTNRNKPFKCKMCGKCCYGKGGIKVSNSEIERISEFLNMTRESFKSKFCEFRNGHLTIKAGDDGFCAFFDREKTCLVHEVKPEICFLWPFYEANLNDEFNWQLAKDACPGINPDFTHGEFIKQGKK